jgi:adenine-specific DNA-methyltransferase
VTGTAFGLTFADKPAILQALYRPGAATLRIDEEKGRPGDGVPDAVLVGDNLEALRLLLPAYTGRVQTIYIDPPYNTGNDFVFRDRFAEGAREYLQRTGQIDEHGSPLVANPSTDGRYHSAWLAMMYPRLWLARQLLRDDGALFCSIDDNEVHHLRMILDEIFGEECFIAQVVVVGNRGGRDYMRIAVTHEYVLVYGATPQAKIREVAKEGAAPKFSDDRGPYDLRELRNRNPKFHPGNRPNLFYPVYVHPELTDAQGGHAVSSEPAPGYEIVIEPRNSAGEGSVWRWGKPKLQGAIAEGDPNSSEVVAKQRRDGGWNLYEKHRKTTTKARSLWGDPSVRSERGTIELRERLGAAVFDHPKPTELVRRCVELGTDPDGIVLDFFAGSGTTAEAVHEQNRRDGGTRRTLLVQFPETTPEESAARKAGYETISDVLHARLHAMPPGPGLRWFEVVPKTDERFEPTPSTGEDYLAALRAQIARREGEVPAPWPLAVARGVGLDAVVEQRERFTVFTDRQRQRCVACSDAEGLTAAEVDALDLPPGATIATRVGALADSDRLALASRYVLWTP